MKITWDRCVLKKFFFSILHNFFSLFLHKLNIPQFFRMYDLILYNRKKFWKKIYTYLQNIFNTHEVIFSYSPFDLIWNVLRSKLQFHWDFSSPWVWPDADMEITESFTLQNGTITILKPHLKFLIQLLLVHKILYEFVGLLDLNERIYLCS